jgi:hypothetical protein
MTAVGAHIPLYIAQKRGRSYKQSKYTINIYVLSPPKKAEVANCRGYEMVMVRQNVLVAKCNGGEL